MNPSDSITEGTTLFEEYQACALRETERSLLLAASHYRRALDLMMPSSCHWAHVTLYYGTWLAARALLGLFGCAVFKDHVIEVVSSRPGSQSLIVRKIGSRNSQYHVTNRSSHKQFWEIFYNTVPGLIGFVPIQFGTFLTPMYNDAFWLIQKRNEINYSVDLSFEQAGRFSDAFDTTRFPNSLPGFLQTQYRVCEGILGASTTFAKRCGLATDGTQGLGSTGSFVDDVRQHVYGVSAPNLVGMTNWQNIF